VLNYVSDMTEAVGFVDLDMESVLYQNSEELFSLFDLVRNKNDLRSKR
jgi:hypothetical protein